MVELKKNLGAFDPLPSDLNDTDYIHVGRDGEDYKANADQVLKQADIVSDLANSSEEKAASAKSANDLKILNDFVNLASGLVFSFNAVWTITRDANELTVTIPSGAVLRIDNSNQIVFSSQVAAVIPNGGGISMTITGNSVAFNFYDDISDVTEGADPTIFVIAKNFNGVLRSRLTTVSDWLYANNTAVTDLSWLMDISIVNADPGAEDFRMNNATPSLVTALYFSKTSHQGIDVTNALLDISNGSEIQIRQNSNPLKYIIGTAGDPVDHVGYVEIPFTPTDQGTLFDSTAECSTSIFYEQVESVSDITRSVQNPVSVTNVLFIDFHDKNEVVAFKSGGGGINILGDVQIAFGNLANATRLYVYLDVQADTQEITINDGVISNDSRWLGNVLTLPIGLYALTIDFNGVGNDKFLRVLPEQPHEISLALSDEATDLALGTSIVTYRVPRNETLIGVRINVNTAPTGSSLIVDVNKGGVSVLSPKVSIDAGEKTSVTAANAYAISTPTLEDDSEITFDIDQVGATIPAKGLKITLYFK